MQIYLLTACCFALISFAAGESSSHKHKHHKKHHHHGKHHHKHHHGKHHNTEVAKAAEDVVQHNASTPTKLTPTQVKTVAAQTKAATTQTKDEQLVAKMKALESRLAEKKKAQELAAEKGHLLVSGPLPADFSERFSQAVAQATGADAKKVKVTGTSPAKDQPDVFAVDFNADPKIVKDVESQSTDPDSKLANGNLHSFLVAKDTEDADAGLAEAPNKEDQGSEATPVQEKGLDIDTAMPYGELEPFGREDTAQELTEDSISESNEMVDQLERAEVAEEKRAVFRALTRLRGAAITSFDGVARAQTGQIDEYNKIHQWRRTHPLHHLADEESDVSKWAFPDNADFIQMPKKSGAQKK